MLKPLKKEELTVNLTFSLLRRTKIDTGFKEKVIPLPLAENMIGRNDNF